jgi:hypothetical protein
VIAGYDPNDPVTAEAVGQIPVTYTESLTTDGLKDRRVGVLREPLDPKADKRAQEYQSV